MTRRARMGPLQTLGRGVDRMAPGGRRSAAESPIRPFYRAVGEAGAVEEVEPPPTDPYLRPVSISGGNLAGGGGNNTLRDQLDTTYARLDRTPHSGAFTATFETRTLGFEPTTAVLSYRARSLVPVPNFFRVVWRLGGYCGFGVAPFTDPAFGGGLPLPAPQADWASRAAAWSNNPGEGFTVPTAAAVASGLQVFFDAATSVAEPENAGATFQIDIADVWLELT